LTDRVSVPRLAILLPPSEGKAMGGRRRPWNPAHGRFGPSLGAHRAAVAAALAAAGGGDERLLGVRGQLLDRAREANLSLLTARTMPAGERYTGVVWEALALASATEPVRRRAASSIAVVSALHGAIAVGDPTPDYRLKIGAGLVPLGKLSTWWRGPVSAALAEWTAGRFVVDLLTNDHRAAWEPAQRARGVRVQFADRDSTRSGGVVGGVVGHDAKAAKGRLARHLLEAEGDPLRDLDEWADPRFTLVVTPLR
jgi:cytoplasmic iron level regulating protein YaaA (DUF328/UPF0246 family)